MDDMAAIYQPGEVKLLVFDNGDEMLLGSVVEEGLKHLSYVYSAMVDGETFWAFDAREVPELDGACQSVSASECARVEALARIVVAKFSSRDRFIQAITPTSFRLMPPSAAEGG